MHCMNSARVLHLQSCSPNRVAGRQKCGNHHRRHPEKQTDCASTPHSCSGSEESLAIKTMRIG
jgi:hypothetical protein